MSHKLPVKSLNLFVDLDINALYVKILAKSSFGQTAHAEDCDVEQRFYKEVRSSPLLVNARQCLALAFVNSQRVC